MSFSWWVYPARRFEAGGLSCIARSRARSDGLYSSLEVQGAVVAEDLTPLFGTEAVRNHLLSHVLPEGNALEVELGYMGMWSTGIVARIDGRTVHESHPGRTPSYPEKYRETAASRGSFKEAVAKGFEEGNGDQPNPLTTGAFAKNNRLPLAIDVVTGLLFYFVAKWTDLHTAALLGIAVGLGLIVIQRLTKIDVTGGLVLFGIVMLAISAGLALAFQDDEWIKLRGTITGLIAASLFLFDGWRGGPYIGRGLSRYMPYSDIDAGRFALAMGLVGLIMAALNYVVAKLASTDAWLFYKTFVDFIIVMLLAMVAVQWARRKSPAA